MMSKPKEPKTPEITIKKLRRFSLFIGINGILAGILGVLGGVIAASLTGDMNLFSIVAAVAAGLFWQSSYRAFSSFREMKNFETVEEYMKHLEEQAKN